MERLEAFNDKYTLGTLDFNDMVWYLDYINDKYDPSSLRQLGYSYKDEISIILYFFDKNGEEIEQMSCEFEKTSYGKEKTEDSEWYSNLVPLTVSIPVKSSGHRVFAKFIKEYYETHKAQCGDI